MSGRSKKNSGRGGANTVQKLQKPEDKDKNKTNDFMAGWDVIMGQADQQAQEEDQGDIFGLADFKQVSTDEKLDLLMVAMNKMHKAFQSRADMTHNLLHHEKEGLLVKTQEHDVQIQDYKATKKILVDQMEENSEKVLELEEIVSSLHDENQYMRGVIQKLDRQLTHLEHQLADLSYWVTEMR